MNKKLFYLINKQINAEFYSAFLYFAMSSWCLRKGLIGSANWMKAQFFEEQSHGFIICDELIKSGKKPIFYNIKKPIKQKWNNILEVFNHVLEHEKQVSLMIKKIRNFSYKKKNLKFANFFDLFVDEQKEEEETAEKLCNKLKKIKENKFLLKKFDVSLLKRKILIFDKLK